MGSISLNLPSITTNGDADGSGKCSKIASRHASHREDFDTAPSLMDGEAIRIIFCAIAG